jgi:hypothetical protein
MNLLQLIKQQGGRFILALLIILSLTAAYLYHAFHSREPAEIALIISEPYEAMRQRSSAIIEPHLPGRIWHNIPKTDARLRFTDPKYGFITPTAKFLAVSFNEEGVIYSVRMSPQIEPRPYNDAIKVVLNLQEQWHKAGWELTRAKQYPALANTSELHDRLSKMKGPGTTYWQADNQYQVMLDIIRFKDDRHPNEERYLITLAIAKPWVDFYP